jgi:hypothetical protein
MISIIKLLYLMFNFEALKLYIGKTYPEVGVHLFMLYNICFFYYFSK